MTGGGAGETAMHRRKTRTEKIVLTVVLFGTIAAFVLSVALRSQLLWAGWWFSIGLVFILAIIWSDE